jgi:hypothetical protein
LTVCRTRAGFAGSLQFFSTDARFLNQPTPVDPEAMREQTCDKIRAQATQAISASMAKMNPQPDAVARNRRHQGQDYVRHGVHALRGHAGGRQVAGGKPQVRGELAGDEGDVIAPALFAGCGAQRTRRGDCPFPDFVEMAMLLCKVAWQQWSGIGDRWVSKLRSVRRLS